MSALQQIPQNNPLKITVTFLDDNSNPFDPSVNIQINELDPDGIVTSYQYPAVVVRESVGVYWVIVEATIAGDYIFNGKGSLSNGEIVTTPDVAKTITKSQIT